MLSDAPVSISGKTGIPGHISPATCLNGCITSCRTGGGGSALVSGASASAFPVFGSTYATLTFGSPKMRTNSCRTSSRECPGSIRQFTFACAVCGSALFACPPFRRVATQVVCSSAFNSELVFVGHGVVAPEYRWDDYKDLDAHGKTLVMLIDDPPANAGQPDLFKGKTRTYYGRWTYKYEQAARLGAKAVLIVHTTPTAGYGYDVVRSSWGKEDPQLKLEPGHPALGFAGWITQDAGAKLFEARECPRVLHGVAADGDGEIVAAARQAERLRREADATGEPILGAPPASNPRLERLLRRADRPARHPTRDVYRRRAIKKESRPRVSKSRRVDQIWREYMLFLHACNLFSKLLNRA